MKENSQSKNKTLQWERKGSVIKIKETDKADRDDTDVTVTELNITRENYPVLR